MEAGRELDALVADRVMGWCDLWTDGTNYMMYPPCEQQLGVGYDVRHPVPHYSTDISAAWEVVEKLSSTGHYVNVCRFPCTPRSNVHIQKVKNPFTGELEVPIQLQTGTAALAICRAALKAVGVEI